MNRPTVLSSENRKKYHNDLILLLQINESLFFRRKHIVHISYIHNQRVRSIIQGSNRSRNANTIDLGTEYGSKVGRKLQRYELSDTRACQLLVTTHGKSFWVVPAPEAFSRHSGTCRLLGDHKHPPVPYTLQVGDFLRVGSVGVVVIETHNGVENRALSEQKFPKNYEGHNQ